jgi:hypothetical protein
MHETQLQKFKTMMQLVLTSRPLVDCDSFVETHGHGAGDADHCSYHFGQVARLPKGELFHSTLVRNQYKPGHRCSCNFSVDHSVLVSNSVQEAYPKTAANKQVMAGIMFCDTPANRVEVSANPARKNCWFPIILHHISKPLQELSYPSITYQCIGIC